MPNKDKPAKHKTPNYKLKIVGIRAGLLKGDPRAFICNWVAQPLRATRKDLHIG